MQVAKDNLLILIVDDSEVNQKILAKVVQQQGHQFIFAQNGEQALSIFNEEFIKERKIDLIFMDYQMPVMNGIEATEKIRAIEKQNKVQNIVPIISVSLCDDAEYTKAARRAGISDFADKPILESNIISMLDIYCLNKKNMKINI